MNNNEAATKWFQLIILLQPRNIKGTVSETCLMRHVSLLFCLKAFPFNEDSTEFRADRDGLILSGKKLDHRLNGAGTQAVQPVVDAAQSGRGTGSQYRIIPADNGYVAAIFQGGPLGTDGEDIF